MNDMVKSNSIEKLLPVDLNSERPTVLARDLYEFLGVSTRFNDWFPRMCEYGFWEGIDYYSFLSNRSDGRPGKPKQDAQLTISMAKEICMLQRNERGKQARQYFLKIEEMWNDPDRVIARGYALLQKKVHVLEEKIEEDSPKVLWAEQCLKSKTNMTVEEFSKVIFQKEDIEMGRNKTFAYLREKKLIRSTNLPYQRYMDQGWFVVTVNLIETDRGTFQNKQTLITPKGQQAILKMIKEEQNNASTKELPVQEVYVKLQ